MIPFLWGLNAVVMMGVDKYGPFFIEVINYRGHHTGNSVRQIVNVNLAVVLQKAKDMIVRDIARDVGLLE